MMKQRHRNLLVAAVPLFVTNDVSTIARVAVELCGIDMEKTSASYKNKALLCRVVHPITAPMPLVAQSTVVTCRTVADARRIGEKVQSNTMSFNGSQAVRTKAAKEFGELEAMLSESASSEQVCLKLAKILQVRRSEIALLRSEKGSLRFIFPVELRSAGVLPLSGSAVAARTAATRTPLLSNSFMRMKHVSLFEAVKISAGEEDKSMEQMPIQKIMSVPVASGDKVLGTVQVSRKGLDPKGAGADFTSEDLKKIEQVADILARMPFMQEGAEL